MALVARHGIQGATTSRIAAAVGVSEAALYRHFSSRSEILLATLDLVYERIYRVIEAGAARGDTAQADTAQADGGGTDSGGSNAAQPDALERLRRIARSHSRIITSETEGFVYPLFEFVAAPPEIGLRDALAERQQKAIEAIAAIVDEGKQQGIIKPDVDSMQVAWELVGLYWTQDVSYLMGLTEHLDAGRGERMLNRILSSIARADGGSH
jgi:AcrR family transcriptional regulator